MAAQLSGVFVLCNYYEKWNGIKEKCNVFGL